MVFNAIAFWLLIAAVPLWAYRWLLYSRLDLRERQMIRRLIVRRHERAFGFGLRVFGYLLALAVMVIAVIFTLRYLKHGTIGFSAYSDTIRSRFYSGIDPIDQTLDAWHYDQMLPVAVFMTILALSIGFTLVATALRDIVVIRKLRRKLRRLQQVRPARSAR